MIPKGRGVLQKVAGSWKQPSKNYRAFFESRRILGTCDGKEAMRQVIYKILNTERYRYAVYSWNYGIELGGLFGMPVDYVCPELERRIREALLQDDRIREVKNFVFDSSVPHVVAVTFTAVTDVGEIPAERVVEV